jgi:protein SCO1/2
VRVFRFGVLATLLVLAGIGAYLLGTLLAPQPELFGTPLQNPQQVGDNLLVTPDGDERTLLEVMGDAKVMLVFFGFTRCPDVCPITMARLAKIHHDGGEPGDVRVVMITVDPDHDTPEIIGNYARAFHPDFVGLSGSNSQVAAAARSFFVGYAEIGGGQFTHTEVVAVVDRAGLLRFIYGSDRVPRIEGDLPQLRRLL